MSWFLGGMTIVGIGWAGPQAIWIDFVSTLEEGWRWQLYANRTRIGVTDSPLERRIVGQLPPTGIPFPLTLVRVSEENWLDDHGSELPSQPWNRYRLRWTEADSTTDHFDVIGAAGPGEDADVGLVIAQVPYVGDIPYSYELTAINQTGQWQFGIVPRDNALPLGNAGEVMTVTVNAVVMPADIAMQDDGTRFEAAIAAGVLTADFSW
jgi:hypothetical protein